MAFLTRRCGLRSPRIEAVGPGPALLRCYAPRPTGRNRPALTLEYVEDVSGNTWITRPNWCTKGSSWASNYTTWVDCRRRQLSPHWPARTPGAIATTRSLHQAPMAVWVSKQHAANVWYLSLHVFCSTRCWLTCSPRSTWRSPNWSGYPCAPGCAQARPC